MAKKEEKEEAFYVGIKDPIEIRRSILEASKDTVQHLQRAERFKAIRTEKAEQIAKLKAISKELQSLIRKLSVALPKTKLRTPLYERQKKLKKEEGAVEAEKEEVEEGAEKERMTELERLEAELSEIESKITKLS